MVRGLQARIGIARQQAETRRQLLSTVKLQYEKGIAAELQVRQAEGSLTQVEAQIPVLEAGLDAAMNALDVLLGVQPGTYRAELSPAASIPIAPGLAETGTPAEMIRRRPVRTRGRGKILLVASLLACQGVQAAMCGREDEAAARLVPTSAGNKSPLVGWCDGQVLEDQVREIAASLFAYAEWAYRWGIQREYECQVERKRKLEERIRKERDEAKRKERARIEKAWAGRRDKLMSDAAA